MHRGRATVIRSTTRARDGRGRRGPGRDGTSSCEGVVSTPRDARARVALTGRPSVRRPHRLRGAVRSAAALLLVAASPAAAQDSDEPPERSVRDGVYTEAQAARGKALFAERCSLCHSEFEFSGSGYMRSWTGATLQQLYRVISTMMPYDNPGALAPEEYADVLAHLLELNGLPAGDAELGTDPEALGRIRIEPASGGG